MPAFGPSSTAIVDAAHQPRGDEQAKRRKHDKDIAEILPFQLIDVSSSTLPNISKTVVEHFSASFLHQRFLLANQPIIPGDTLIIRLWEAANDGLFASSGQRETVFTLTVSNSGNIDVPYAGHIEVAGQSVHQIRKELLRRYKGKAIDPEIHVHIAETTSRAISVLGAVAAPGRIMVPAQGIRLHDLMALAGGIPHPPWETTVTVSRASGLSAISSTIELTRVLEHADNNIVMLPGDRLYVEHTPRKFAVYGAITKPGNIAINHPSPKLSALLAESGGLVDLQAEASSVFVFRADPQPMDIQQQRQISTAYRLDFSKPDVFLLAGRFEVLPSDIVYVATADASEFRKFITTLLTPFLGGTGGIQNLSN